MYTTSITKEMLHFPGLCAGMCDALQEKPQPAWQGALEDFCLGKFDRDGPITEGRERRDCLGGGLGDEKQATMYLLTLSLLSRPVLCVASSFPHQWNREVLIIIISQCKTQKENN